MTAPCYRTDDGWALDSHIPACTDRGCTGCTPCTHDDNGNPVRHCQHRDYCTTHLRPGEHACPRCVGKVRGNLDYILTSTAVLAAEAIVAGVDSEALNLSGPYANVVLARWHRVNTARTGGVLEETDWTHAGVALGEWESIVRELLGHDASLLVSDTLSATVSYLSWVLTDLARSEEHQDTLSALATAISELRNHIDAVLHDSRAPEKGAPCFTCALKAPAAAADDPVRVPRLFKQHSHWCTRDSCDKEHDTTGVRDRWVCEKDESHRFTEGEYRLQVERDRIRHSDHLSAADMLERTGVPAGTVRRWAAHTRRRVDGEWVELDPLLRPVGKADNGRLLYRVADVEQLRDRDTDPGA